MENKKLTKYLVFSMIGGLIIFFVVHLIKSHKSDEAAEMPSIGDVHIKDTKLPDTKSRTETLKDLENEKKKAAEKGYEYTQPVDLNKIAEEGDKGVSTFSNTLKQQPPASAGQPAQNNLSQPSANVGYNNPYTNSYRQNSPPVVAQQPSVQATPTAPTGPTQAPNPFGTVKAGSSTNATAGVAGKDYFSAQVYGDQKLQDNTGFTCWNTEPMVYNGSLQIPIHSIFYGIAHFSGNRVSIKITRVKTSAGEFPVTYSVMDNSDKIEGLYYKAPIDEVLETSADQANVNSNVNTQNSIVNNAANGTTRGIVNGAKQLMQKARSLNVGDSYSISLIPVKNK